MHEGLGFYFFSLGPSLDGLFLFQRSLHLESSVGVSARNDRKPTPSWSCAQGGGASTGSGKCLHFGSGVRDALVGTFLLFPSSISPHGK